MEANQARLNITYHGEQGDLPNPVYYDATDVEVRAWAQEAIRSGSVINITADPDADLSGFEIERVPAGNGFPNQLLVRPKTRFA